MPKILPMKQLLTLPSILLLAQLAVAQSAARPTTGSGGGTAMLAGYSYSYTVGEAVSGTNSSPAVLLTLGFQQPEQNGSLPIELLSFTASMKGQTAVLEWTTNLEIQSDHYVLERSIDGFTYERFGKVEAAGYSDSPSHYRFDDQQAGHLGQQVLYYRLRQYDQDGAFSISPVVQLQVEQVAKSSSTLFPNPASTEAFLRYQLREHTTASWSLTTVDGKTIRQGLLTKTNGLLRIPVRQLAEGAYIVVLSTEAGSEAHRLLISH